MIPAMTASSSPMRRLGQAGSAPLRWLAGWWRIVFFGASILVLAMSPSSYGRETRAALMRHIYLDTAPILWWFTALCALLTLVITRIVVVTASSYGLSRYALEMVIRVLVLELIPLTAALFVSLRCTIPNGAALAEMRRMGHFDELRRRGIDPVVTQALPRALAGIFATITLAALSCVVAMVLAYLAVYGWSLAGVAAYTHVFGHVFTGRWRSSSCSRRCFSASRFPSSRWLRACMTSKAMARARALPCRAWCACSPCSCCWRRLPGRQLHLMAMQEKPDTPVQNSEPAVSQARQAPGTEGGGRCSSSRVADRGFRAVPAVCTRRVRAHPEPGAGDR